MRAIVVVPRCLGEETIGALKSEDLCEYEYSIF